MPQRGWDTVSTPGAVAGWVALSERFGKLPFADLMEPALELAERGHGVGIIVAEKWARQVPVLINQPGFADAFPPRGRAPLPGQRFFFPQAGASLRKIAETRGETFYRGEIAEKPVAHSATHGASMTMADLAAFATEWVMPIQKDFAGHTLHEIPPSGQGIAALMARGMLDKLDIGRFAVDSPGSHHLQIEAMKLAFADTYRWVANSHCMTEVTAAGLLSDGYLSERARLIQPGGVSAFVHGTPPGGGTIYLTAAVESGCMISFIQSNDMGFGGVIVVPGTGVSLHNRGHCFGLKDGHPNQVAPGRRPFHTIIPGFLTRAIQPQMTFGVMGGNLQPQGHLQTLVRMLVHQHQHQQQTACDAPRWKVGEGLNVDFEATMSPDLISGLKAMGHQFNPTADNCMDFGSGQFIWQMSDDPADGYVPASDARRDGQAVGF